MLIGTSQLPETQINAANFGWLGPLKQFPNALLTAETKLETEHELTGSKIPECMDKLKLKWPKSWAIFGQTQQRGAAM
jgi:hypothetical protein